MNYTYIILFVLLLVFVLFQFRSSRRKKQQQEALQKKMVAGTPVMLTFGLYGTIVDIHDDENIAEVEIAPGTVIKVHKQTLGRVVEPVPADDEATTTSSTEPTYSLNEDHAISATEPDFGERVDTTPTTRDADKPDA
ncbi:preprotein translocase subunit YajC [Frondihabitans australicus]|uniref:Preprotein translocase subunit YajC n=1 Tax=Frondihabitans australicus TaxID=386892 RepID=A0A495IG78_9MICO|nr:preprotein translocase subunit YajC [Frondihabitans australicus]RKR74076.1 preprotein translocase subunit YajC [Frondihabitans australicus]